MNRSAWYVKRDTLTAALERVNAYCHLFVFFRLFSGTRALLVGNCARGFACRLAGRLAFAATGAHSTLYKSGFIESLNVFHFISFCIL
jgi:hypothetical protein